MVVADAVKHVVDKVSITVDDGCNECIGALANRQGLGMKLVGGFQGFKSGTFKPEDSDDKFPYAFGKIRDEDGEGYIKVKPASSDADDLAEFMDVLKSLKKGDRVAWVVTVDRYGNVRYAEDAV
jgi:hypothetical protein